MDQEEIFLRQIMENPTDNQARLTYADWLEDQGDDRAEILRLQVQLTQIEKASKKAEKIRSNLQRRCREAERCDWASLVCPSSPKDKLQECFDTLELELSSANYCPTILARRAWRHEGDHSERYIREMVDQVTLIGSIKQVGLDRVMLAFEQFYNSPNNRRSGVQSRVFGKESVRQSWQYAVNYLEESFTEALRVEEFWLINGVTFEAAVTWPFSFLIIKPRCAVALLGGVSD